MATTVTRDKWIRSSLEANVHNDTQRLSSRFGALGCSRIGESATVLKCPDSDYA